MRFVLAMYVVSGGVLWLAARCVHRRRRMQQLRRPVSNCLAKSHLPDPPTTVFPALGNEPIVGFRQMNFIEQWHPSFSFSVSGAA